MHGSRGRGIDILKSVSAARIQSWVDGSNTGSYPLGEDETRTDEEIIASLPYQALGQRVEYFKIERYVLTSYLDGTQTKYVASPAVYTSDKYYLARIPGETRLQELRQRHARELTVDPTVKDILHIFADHPVAA